MRKTLLAFLLLLLAIYSWGAGYDISKLTNNDGLSNSSINVVYQTSEGLMWFGTWDGLDVYDGKEFKVFKPELDNAASISNNIIRDVIEQRPGIVWIATDLGINRFDTGRKRFDRFFFDTQKRGVTAEQSFRLMMDRDNAVFAYVLGLGFFRFDDSKGDFVPIRVDSGFTVRKAFFDASGSLWALSDDGKMMRIALEKDKDGALAVGRASELGKISGVRSAFYDAASDRIWMQTADGRIYSYDVPRNEFSLSEIRGAEVGMVNCIAFCDGNVFLGSAKGLFRFNAKEGRVSTVLQNATVLSVYAGTQQIVWVGTDMQGVWQLSPTQEKFISYPGTADAAVFNNCAVRAFFLDSEDCLWIGTKGDGISVFTRNASGRQSLKGRFDVSNGLLDNSVYTIIDGKEEIWIGTDGKGINYYDKRRRMLASVSIPDSLKGKISLSSIYSILPDGGDVLWVGTSGYGLYQLVVDRSDNPYSIKSFRQYVYKDGQPSLSNNIVYSIIRDDATHLWIATRGGGLNRFDTASGKFETLHFWPESRNYESSDDVLCLCKDSKGKLWAGTSMGLYRLSKYVKGKPVFDHFSEKEGLPNNTVHGILEDSQHCIWLSTNRGIAKLILSESGNRIITYNQKDGLQNNEFSDGAFYRSPRRSLFYFGGIDGYNVFDPKGIANSSYMPSLLMDAFFVDNREVSLSDFTEVRNGRTTLVLKHDNNFFSFRFVPIDYLSGNKCEISYLLEGFQKDWIQLGTSNTVVFSNLPTGSYTLKVRCSDADKIWSDDYYSLDIRMLPPWYATPLAYAAYFLLLALALWGIYRLIRYQISVKEKIRDEEQDKRKMEEIHEAKLQFFTNIAHEFSNSLTLIYGPCEQLLHGRSSSSDTKKYLNVIESNSERMQSLIQQLIEFRKAESGHLNVSIEPVDVVELARCESDYYLEIFEQKHIVFTLEALPEKIVWNTDRDSLEKVVFNLLSNAVKYTPEGEHISLSLSLTEGRQLRLEVRNTGTGIEEKYRKQIFDRYEVLNKFEDEVSAGLATSNGIGLALCKSLVELLDGSIEVESDGSSYTCFVVVLPERQSKPWIQDEAEPKEVEAAEAVPELVQAEKKKEGVVLVVDDEKEIRDFICDILGDRYAIDQACNGKEAFEVMQKRVPTIIICDVIMPEMDGVEFVKRLKGDEMTRHIPVILLSAKSSVENQIEGLETGADAYLGKPFHPRHLQAVINSLLHREEALMDYSKSPYSALEQFEGNLVKKEDKELITAITEVIYNNIDNDKLSIDLIAGETAVSKMQLYRKIKETLNMTPTEYIRFIRLEQAEKLLKTTNKTVQEIMYDCGFNSKTYFYREFAKKYHVTPKEYRDNCNKKKRNEK
jgi:signal transduction histidine kinase/ligand-binding sensor domain-containing protein/DNA-binding response OmpR family regulator